MKLFFIFLATLALSQSPTHAAISIFWDFYNVVGNSNGWTTFAGTANYRAGDGDGVGPANPTNTGYAHDGAHPNFIFRSPLLSFANAANSGNVMVWGTSGGAGDQEGNGPDYASPGAVLAFNGGNSRSDGEKGLAFLNLVTGQYDAVLFNLLNGGTDINNYTLAQLISAGVDPTKYYFLDFYETDQGSWGWGQTNFINLDAIIAPEPSRAMLLAASLCLVGGVRRRSRQ
jgi:hypothetical protein